MDSSTRIVVNTAIVYVKLLIGIALGLFTTRLVLEALGETDYGVFILVGGVIGMLAILNSSMSNASMRFMAHSLGSADPRKVKLTFNTTLHLHILIGLLLIVVMEIGGYFMFEYVINIPEGRFFAAQIVFHSMVLTTFVTIVSVPYDAVINAHENLLFLSAVDVVGYILKLGLAIYLFYSSYDLLIIYGIVLLVIQVIQRLIKQIYSRRKYPECQIDFKNFKDTALRKEIIKFSWWNLFGSIASMSVTQFRSLILNVFFGVEINAAEGISKTASNQVNIFSTSLTRALNPQLVKSEGNSDRLRMIKLTEIGTKFSGFLFCLISVPAIFEMPYLLKLWLTSVPEYAVIFSRLMLISLLVGKLTFELTNAFRAIGNIRRFQISETLIIIISLPLIYVLFKNGYSPEYFFYIMLLVSFVVGINRIYLGKIIAQISPFRFFNNAILPVIIPLIVSGFVSILIISYLEQNIYRLLINIFSNVTLLTSLFWYIGLTKVERGQIFKIFKNLKTIKQK